MAKIPVRKEDAADNPNDAGGGTTVKIAKMAMWQAILVALITAVGSASLGYLGGANKQDRTVSVEKPISVVPIQNTNLVEQLPEESNSDLYRLVKDISIYDLRQWKPTPQNLMSTRFSPCNYTNYLHIKKTRPLSKIVIHYATSGFAIDMRCITSPFKFYQLSKPIAHEGQNMKEYALVVDVSDMVINKEYLIVVEATYWNGFNNLVKEEASTYTDEEIHGLDELGLIVFFPDSKPFKNYRLRYKPKNEEEEDYRNESAFYADEKKKFIYWSIKSRLANHHYKLEWDW